jgi:putative DNA primase/helicase
MCAVTAEAIAKALHGRRVGDGWMARCPGHNDRDPSLSIRDADDGKVLLRCHAGCDQAQVIAELRRRGLWAEHGPPRSRPVRPQPRRAMNDRAEDTERTGAALSIWQATVPAVGTPVEIYLRSRGIGIALPPTIRFHTGLRHPSGGTWPAMVALVSRGRDDAPLAIHRTFLSRDGAGKAAVEPQRMMLGPCRGGAVRLAPVGDTLMVGEGMETADAITGHIRPTSRPDVDNYLKAILDAINTIVVADDTQVVEVYAKKKLSVGPKMIATIFPLDATPSNRRASR